MLIKRVNEIFNIIQGHQITEEEIYNSNGNIPIYTGDNENIGYVKKAIISKDDLPCISYPTKGEVGKLYVQEELFNANNTGVLVLKKEWKDKIDLYWIVSYLSPIIGVLYNSREGIGYIGKNTMENIVLEIPDYDKQKEIGKLYKQMRNIKSNLREIIKRENQNKEKIEINGEVLKVKEVLTFVGGNQGLTKEYIYNNQPISESEKIKIYSGSVEKDTSMGYISDKSNIKIEKGPAIVVTRKGNAGHLSIIKDKRFAINDDAYVIKIKKEWENKINIHWFIHQYQDLFFNVVTSKSDNATFSKSYMKEQTICIPKKKDQDIISKGIKKYEYFIGEISKIESKIEDIIRCQIL